LTTADVIVVGLKAPGAATELDALATATGGSVQPLSDDSSNIAEAILDGLKEIAVEVTMTSNCFATTGGVVRTRFSDNPQTVTSGEVATFIEWIGVASDAPGGTYTCEDEALIDGSSLRPPLIERKIIKVPEGYLTGGGQIGKGKKAQNFGGNVGFLRDFSIVGQWQFRDGDLKLNMHSLSIDTLQFSNDAGPDPDPPPANAEVATFSGTARVKLGTAQWDYGCSFLAQAHDHGEPDVADVFGIVITCGSDVWTYGRELLDTGNLQIHSGLKD
jgi:hypothetical protein